jgi:hypothetical protein
MGNVYLFAYEILVQSYLISFLISLKLIVIKETPSEEQCEEIRFNAIRLDTSGFWNTIRLTNSCGVRRGMQHTRTRLKMQLENFYGINNLGYLGANGLMTSERNWENKMWDYGLNSSDQGRREGADPSNPLGRGGTVYKRPSFVKWKLSSADLLLIQCQLIDNNQNLLRNNVNTIVWRITAPIIVFVSVSTNFNVNNCRLVFRNLICS